jgi:hypothetical protein
MKNLLVTAILLLALSSCGNKKSNPDTVKFPPPVVMADEEVMASPPEEKELEVADPGVKSVKGDASVEMKIDEPVANADVKQVKEFSAVGEQPKIDTSRKIIKDGDISFEANDIAGIRKKILNSLKKLNGYVVEDKETTDNEENRKDYTLNVRIPAKSFDLLLDFVTSAADKIDSKNISITDVTTRYVDINTRLNNKKLLENRYQDLLKKATKISDLLEIENKLTEIRSDIESTQGQLNYLNRQVAYSSLAITFYTKQIIKADKPIGFGYKFKRALGKGWMFLQNLFFRVIALWPLCLLLIAMYIGYKTWKRKNRLTRQSLQE